MTARRKAPAKKKAPAKRGARQKASDMQPEKGLVRYAVDFGRCQTVQDLAVVLSHMGVTFDVPENQHPPAAMMPFLVPMEAMQAAQAAANNDGD